VIERFDTATRSVHHRRSGSCSNTHLPANLIDLAGYLHEVRMLGGDKRPDGSFVLIFRPELALCSQDVVRRPTTEAQPDPASGEIVPPEERLLCQNEVDRIRANTDGERQLTGFAFTLDLVRARLTPRVTVGPRPGDERSSFRRPPKR
jgi:hypothetical protein